MRLRALLPIGLLLMFIWPMRASAPSIHDLKRMIKVLKPLHQPLGQPGPGDWLASHKEDGQTFKEYLSCEPVLPTPSRRVIYVQPIGRFSPSQKRLVDLVTEGMGIYLCLPVTVLPTLPATAIPDKARRVEQDTGELQFLTSYILEKVLEPNLPEDASACIALSATDLWPGKGWNYVFGQASIQNRVGVWSIARLGYTDKGPQPFNLCFLRALGTAVHETCHMFSFHHCTAYECNMCGSNSLEEGDRHPLWLCPQCLAKLCYAVGADPVARYRQLENFCSKNGLGTEANFYRRSADTLERGWHPEQPAP